MKHSSVLNNPNRRISYNGISRNSREWAVEMGYDYDCVVTFARKNGYYINDVVEKLVRYVYGGEQCTYPIRNSRKPKDLCGMRFGRLKAVDRIKGQTYRCVCDCGRYTVAQRYRLLIGEVRSCGCLRRESQDVFKQCRDKGIPLTCRRLVFQNKNLTITEWAKQPEIINLGIKRRNIYSRLRAGWSIERTLTEPCHRPKE